MLVQVKIWSGEVNYCKAKGRAERFYWKDLNIENMTESGYLEEIKSSQSKKESNLY